MNKDILEKLFPDMVKLIEEGKCPTCGNAIKIEDFTDPLSVKEFRISGMCQTCQNKTFGGTP